MFHVPLAEFDFAIMIPIVAFMIPIIAILTAHQRKMAEIMRNDARMHPQNNEISELRREMSDLKAIVSQQAIQMDDFLTQQRQAASQIPPRIPQDVQERLNS